MTVPSLSRPFPWLLAALLGAVGLSGCGFSLQQLPKLGDLTAPHYSVDAEFANVLNLPDNAQVREGAVVIGQVGTISVTDFVAKVQLKIENKYRLPVGTTAEVRFDNPLGEEYVLMTPPAHPNAGDLRSGALLTSSQTDTAPSVEDTFAALSTVLNGGGIAQLGTIIHEVNQTFAGNQPQIRSLLGEINTAVTSLATNSSAVDGALSAIGGLFQELNRNSGTLVTGIDTIGPAIKILADENGQFGQLLDGLTQLSAVGNAVTQQSGQNTITAIKSLQPVVQQLVGVEQQLAPDLADLQQFETETPKIIPGNYLQVSATANVYLNSSPTVASAAAASVATPGPLQGIQAVSAILQGGLR
jgi:phospholipid/cholesterol/gamma-HCH transport system substrate-binding protein